jgi:hypothetical protein
MPGSQGRQLRIRSLIERQQEHAMERDEKGEDRAATAADVEGHRDRSQVQSPSPAGMLATVSGHLGRGLLQRKLQRRAAERRGETTGEAAQSVADRGVGGAGGPLPHLDAIQRAFGHHDVRGVVAHTDGAAAAAANDLGAAAFATGSHVAFGDAPTLHTASHEAAHVVQQRAGVQLAGGMGQEGDPHEQHADAVADRVVRGESVERLLDQYAGAGVAHSPGGAIQRKGGGGNIPPLVGELGLESTTKAREALGGEVFQTLKALPIAGLRPLLGHTDSVKHLREFGAKCVGHRDPDELGRALEQLAPLGKPPVWYLINPLSMICFFGLHATTVERFELARRVLLLHARNDVALATAIMAWLDEVRALGPAIEQLALRELQEARGDLTVARPILTFIAGYRTQGERVMQLAHTELLKAARNIERARGAMDKLARYNFDPEMLAFAEEKAQQVSGEEFEKKKGEIQGDVEKARQTHQDTLNTEMPKFTGSGMEKKRKEKTWKTNQETLKKDTKDSLERVETDAPRRLQDAEVQRGVRHEEVMGLVERLAPHLSVTEQQELHDHLGVEGVEALGAAIGGGAIAELLRGLGNGKLLSSWVNALPTKSLTSLEKALGATKMVELWRAFTVEAFVDALGVLGTAKLAELAAALPAIELVPLCHPGTGPKKLKPLVTVFTGVELKQLHDRLTLVELKRVADIFEATELGALCHEHGVGAGQLAIFVANVPGAKRMQHIRSVITVEVIGSILVHQEVVALLGQLLPITNFEHTNVVLRMLAIPNMDVPRLHGLLTSIGTLNSSVGALWDHLQVDPNATGATWESDTFNQIKSRAKLTPQGTKKITTGRGDVIHVPKHRSNLTGEELEVLYQNSHVKFVYISTFKTTTETVNGGDTDEYNVLLYDDTNGVWETDAHWVVHTHRERGSPRKGTGGIAHLKRYAQRKLKDALRNPISRAMEQACKDVTPN